MGEKSAEPGVAQPASLPRSAERTREKIFLAAQAIAAEEGIEGLTTKRVCERAGVSNGTFFYHFKTKGALLSYFLQEGFDRFYEEYRGELDVKSATDNAVELRVVGGFVLYARYCLQTGVGFMRAYYVGSNKALDGRPEALGRPFLNQQMTDCAATLAQVCDERAPEVARGCCTVVKGCVFEWCVSNGQLDLVEHVKEMLAAYLAGALGR